jgi:hypothetical protein
VIHAVGIRLAPDFVVRLPLGIRAVVLFFLLFVLVIVRNLVVRLAARVFLLRYSAR